MEKRIVIDETSRSSLTLNGYGYGYGDGDGYGDGSLVDHER